MTSQKPLRVVAWLVGGWLGLALVTALGLEVARHLKKPGLPMELAGLVKHPVFAGREAEAKGTFDDVFRSVVTTSTYDAFNGWHYGAFESKTWTTDANGYRQVPGRPPQALRRIYLFGGSTLAGWGVPPADSILAKVQALLPDAEVVSGAHGAYTSRQGLTGLLRTVSERGDLGGDVVVFYDGYNDFWVGCAVGDPSLVTLFEATLGDAFRDSRARRTASPLGVFAAPFWRPFAEAYAQATGQAFRDIPQGSRCDAEPARRQRIAAQFVRNWRMAKGVTEQFGGHFVGFFGPALPLSKNRGDSIPAPVRAIIDQRDVAFAQAQRETVAAVRALDQPWARELTTLYDADSKADVFLDATHVTAAGAELAARAIVDAVRPLLGAVPGATAPQDTRPQVAITAPALGASASPTADDGPFLDCPAAAVNALGVGKPCTTQTDCAGQRAVTCLAATEDNGFPFCTTFCFGLVADECGPAARCIQRGDRPGVCAPQVCAARLEVQPAASVAIDKKCTAGQANDFGVGKPCSSHADCAGFRVARSCAVIFKPTNPAWCSVLCSSDAECGPGAFCWAEATVEQGVRLTVRSCAPIACKLPAGVSQPP
ncbi:MAG: hypothetical protein EXR79_02340 [Myxococcales bacterium]|nr:hypothetical protein [Myxococcales bacterium]